MPKPTLQPVSLHERIQTIDIIRGFALFSILVVNFTVDVGAIEPWFGWSGAADQLVYWTVEFFMNDKFLAIYAFLFGLGFSIQMLRAESRNSPFVIMYMRRLFILYLIGAIFQILTGEVDILLDYAMVGVLLLLLHKIPTKILPVLALLCVLVPTTREILNSKDLMQSSSSAVVSVDTAILDGYVGVYERVGEPGRLNIITREGNKIYNEGRSGKILLLAKSETVFGVEGNSDRFAFLKDSTGAVNKFVIHLANGNAIVCLKTQMDIQQAIKKMAEQRAAILDQQKATQKKLTYKQSVVRNASGFWNSLRNWSWNKFFWKGYNISEILPLFLLGLYTGRRKIFYETSSNRQFLNKIKWWGLLIGGIGVAINLGFSAWDYINGIKWESHSPWTKFLVGSSWDFGVMIMALGYVAAFILFLEKADMKKRLSFLAPVGRMGLTNYLIQAILFVLVFNYGLNLDGKVGPFWRLMLAFPAFAIIIFISRWWFKRFRIGPFEWLWRSLTYWKIQPMRLKEKE